MKSLEKPLYKCELYILLARVWEVWLPPLSIREALLLRVHVSGSSGIGEGRLISMERGLTETVTSGFLLLW